MLAEILANTVGGILSQVLGTMLKQPMDRLFDEYYMQHALTDSNNMSIGISTTERE